MRRQRSRVFRDGLLVASGFFLAKSGVVEPILEGLRSMKGEDAKLLMELVLRVLDPPLHRGETSKESSRPRVKNEAHAP